MTALRRDFTSSFFTDNGVASLTSQHFAVLHSQHLSSGVLGATPVSLVCADSHRLTARYDSTPSHSPQRLMSIWICFLFILLTICKSSTVKHLTRDETESNGLLEVNLFEPVQSKWIEAWLKVFPHFLRPTLHLLKTFMSFPLLRAFHHLLFLICM